MHHSIDFHSEENIHSPTDFVSFFFNTFFTIDDPIWIRTSMTLTRFTIVWFVFWTIPFTSGRIICLQSVAQDFSLCHSSSSYVLNNFPI